MYEEIKPVRLSSVLFISRAKLTGRTQRNNAKTPKVSVTDPCMANLLLTSVDLRVFVEIVFLLRSVSLIVSPFLVVIIVVLLATVLVLVFV